MEKFVSATRKFLNDEEGVTAIEYGLIAALIAVVILATLVAIGGNLNNVFLKIKNCLAGLTAATCVS